jgi:hypothetical protein
MPRSGDLHVTKECSKYKGMAGDFCTITSSNLEEIEVGSIAGFQTHADVTTDTGTDCGIGKGRTASTEPVE